MRPLHLNVFLLATAAAAAAASFKAPERAVLRKYSSAQGQVLTIENELLHAGGKDTFLIGDSTVRTMQPNPDGSDPDLRLINLGAGGSRPETWRLILELASDELPDVHSVIFAMSGGGSSLESSASNVSYRPFLLRTKELLKNIVQRKRAVSELATWLAPLLSCSDEVLLGAFTGRNASLAAFLRDSMFSAQSRRQGSPQVDPEYDLREILAVLERKKLKAVFVNSPASSAVRGSPEGTQGKIKFQSLCQAHSMRCMDLSAAFPDEFFGFDGVHLLPQKHDAFRKLLRDAANER